MMAVGTIHKGNEFSENPSSNKGLKRAGMRGSVQAATKVANMARTQEALCFPKKGQSLSIRLVKDRSFSGLSAGVCVIELILARVTMLN